MGDFLQNVPIEANNTIVLLVRKVCLIKINKKETSESTNKSYSPIRVHQNPPFFLVNYTLRFILTHLAYIANGKKTCYIVQQFHWANKRDVTLRHL